MVTYLLENAPDKRGEAKNLLQPGSKMTSSEAITNPAFDAIWIGDKTAEEALTEIVPEGNAVLEEARG